MSKQQEKHDNENYSKNFTRIPNILFASYTKLTKEEKFLYCTLREVYWDMKPRFVSTRDLSDLTGYSRGALGNMLPRLHDCGLIHAEVRREKDKDGKEKGNAKYHISILDIWELNRRFFESSIEDREKMDPSLKLVHKMDKNSCPQNGQACPPNEPNLSTKKAKLGTSDGQDQAQVELAKDITKDPLKKVSKSHTDPPALSLSPEEQSFYDLWSQKPFSVVKPKITPTLKDHCAALAPHIKTEDQLTRLIVFAREDDHVPAGKPVKLGNLVNALNGWLQVQAQSSQPPRSSLSKLRDLRSLSHGGK